MRVDCTHQYLRREIHASVESNFELVAWFYRGFLLLRLNGFEVAMVPFWIFREVEKLRCTLARMQNILFNTLDNEPLLEHSPASLLSRYLC